MRSTPTSSYPGIPFPPMLGGRSETAMPRHRKRKTNRKAQEERLLRVRGVRRGTPDARKLSRAFIGLALARAEAEAQAQVGTSRPGGNQERHDRGNEEIQDENL